MSTAAILVIDDEPGVRFFLEEALRREGYQVTAVDSGEAALEVLAHQEFDLVLTDLKLQGIDGTAVLGAVRREAPDTIVILLTAHATLESAVDALRQGAHDYLFKPCRTLELRESVRTGLLKRQQALRQRQLLAQLEARLSSTLEEIRASAPKGRPLALPTSPLEDVGGRFLQYNSLIVDFARHLITLDGALLELSPTEFDLLAYLISEAPRVVPAQELVRAAQGYECAPQEASELIRSHIYRIRQKARQSSGRTALIRTVRGVGYTLDCD